MKNTRGSDRFARAAVKTSLALCVTCGSAGLASAQGTLPSQPPPNTWVKVAGTEATPWEPIVYDPLAGQVMMWANIRRSHYAMAGVAMVRHFDAAKQVWTDDYPVPAGTKDQDLIIYGFGQGGKWRMQGDQPYPADVFDAAAYCPKTREVVYSRQFMMAAYNVETKKWRDMKAETELWGTRVPGGPPVDWAAMCYDPVNDELMMFSHAGGMNFDDFDANGFVGGHLGTLVYSFKDNLWRRLDPGSAEFKQGRALLRDTWWDEGRVIEKAWRGEVQRVWKPEEQKTLTREAAEIQKAVLAKAEKAAAEVKALAGKLTDKEERERLGLAARALEAGCAEMKAAQAALEAGQSYDGYRTAFNLVQKLRNLYRFQVLAEPPERNSAPMALDRKNNCIVVFGGSRGGPEFEWNRWNDTWIYDCKTRRWRESRCAVRPPARAIGHALVYHPASGKIILASAPSPTGDLWTYDVAADQWTANVVSGPATPEFLPACNGGFDEKSGLLVMHCGARMSTNGANWVLRFEPAPAEKSAGAAVSVPALAEPFPIPDDPAILEGLKALPANQWVNAKCPRSPAPRDWGPLSCDLSTGYPIFFGGGHSTYQGDDPDIYLPGANRWVAGHPAVSAAMAPQIRDAGDGSGVPGHNFNGWCWTWHSYNNYGAADGKMYLSMYSNLPVPYGPPKPKGWYDKHRAKGWLGAISVFDFWQYDLDRRMWRTLQPGGNVGPGDDRLHGLFPMPRRVAGVDHSLKAWHEYDAEANAFVSHPDQSIPPWTSEPCNFAYDPARHQLFTLANQKNGPMKTYAYDLAAAQATDLAPKASPPDKAVILGVFYVPDQDGALAAVADEKQQLQLWLYSRQQNTWARLDAKVPGKWNSGPYAQMVYSARYKVLVYYCGSTALLRPDFSQIQWDAASGNVK
jgi:hypothetical protein